MTQHFDNSSSYNSNHTDLSQTDLSQHSPTYETSGFEGAEAIAFDTDYSLESHPFDSSSEHSTWDTTHSDFTHSDLTHDTSLMVETDSSITTDAASTSTFNSPSDISSPDDFANALNVEAFNFNEASQPFTDSATATFSTSDLSSDATIVSQTSANSYTVEDSNSLRSSSLEEDETARASSLSSTASDSSSTTGIMAAPSNCSEPLTTNSRNACEVSTTGNVYWHGYRMGQAGTVKGHKYYDNGGYYIGKLGSDLTVYDKDGRAIGYVTPGGCAYTQGGHLFAKGSTVRWAAATLAFNMCYS
jgi:hypothetical protein